MPTTTIDVFQELKRRVDFTRRARIQASMRLRKKHEFYELTNYIYSFSILILSVWVIGVNDDSSYSVTKVLLISSITITFFTMFLGIKNYKERASNIESNYLQLNVLMNKMQRLEASPHLLTHNTLKSLHREYENLLIGNENHLKIDFMMSTKQTMDTYARGIFLYHVKEWSKKICLYIPLVCLIIFLMNII